MDVLMLCKKYQNVDHDHKGGEKNTLFAPAPSLQNIKVGKASF